MKPYTQVNYLGRTYYLPTQSKRDWRKDLRKAERDAWFIENGWKVMLVAAPIIFILTVLWGLPW